MAATINCSKATWEGKSAFRKHHIHRFPGGFRKAIFSSHFARGKIKLVNYVKMNRATNLSTSVLKKF
jgi:hypothetical protein